jgi:glyoxylase-like metal-dependent hydrolase (beta-lactamase superfamily II)
MSAPEELAPGVYRIDAAPLPGAVNVFAVRGAEGWTLIDTGLPGSPRRIRRALAALGVEPAALTAIYLTHHHQDHVGGLPDLRLWAPQTEVVAPEHEAEIIAGDRPMDRSSSPLFRFLQRWNSLPVVPVTRVVSEGETIAGFRVVATPGHSLGHTSLVSDERGLLLTGDAFGAMPRRLRVGVRRAFCADPALARRSAEKLLEEDYQVVAFSHGPVLRGDPKSRLRQVVAECRYL